ncbi:uncharacterized, partial [Tachysurus ichikawai]
MSSAPARVSCPRLGFLDSLERTDQALSDTMKLFPHPDIDHQGKACPDGQTQR